ncbi:MAG: cadherin-like domain-containing protein, partial [Halioglobus sp.]
GDTTEGSTLTPNITHLFDADGLGVLSYQWQAQSAAGNWYDISSATADTFTTTSAESGQAVRVMLSWTDLNGTAESFTSSATALISEVNNVAQVMFPSMTIVQSGQTVAVSRSDLGVSDSDDADSAVTIQVSDVSNGEFKRSGTAVNEFTLADVANNLITFVHDGSHTAPVFSVAAKDDANGATYRSPVAATISFRASINQQPTLAGTSTTQIYSENGDAVAIAPGDFAIDPKNSGDQIQQITLTVTQVADGVDEVLTIDGTRIGLEAGDHTTSNGHTVTVSLGGSTATVTITFASPVSAADAATLVTAITYEHVGNAPSTANDRVISVVVQDNGGTANGGADTSTSQTLNTIAVVASNDAPQIIDLDANPTTYVEGNPPVVIDPDWSIVDAERAGMGNYADTTLTIARQ